MRKNTLLKSVIILSIIFTHYLSTNAQWTPQQSGTNINLYSIHFIDNNNGFCVGDIGTVCKTTNGGDNWTTSTVASANLNYVRIFSTDNIVIGSRLNTMLFRSTNGGNNWTNLTLPESNKKLQFVSFSHGFFLTDSKFYKTTNGGQNWTGTIVPFFGFGGTAQDFHFLNENTGWLSVVYFDPYPWPYGSYHSRVNKTTNAGVNWAHQYTKATDMTKTYRIFFANLNLGFLNEDSVAYSLIRTSNGGLNWNNVLSSGSSKKYYSMSFPSTDTGFFTGDQTIKTINSGATWSTIITPSGNVYRSVFFINNLTGWIAGNGGLIAKTVTGATKIKPISNVIPETFQLFQNYPNPFNPNTNIEFLIPKSGHVSLIIYNILGKEVAIVYNDYLKAGNYIEHFDGSNLSSGVYFYRLTAGDFISTKKMVLIK